MLQREHLTLGVNHPISPGHSFEVFKTAMAPATGSIQSGRTLSTALGLFNLRRAGKAEVKMRSTGTKAVAPNKADFALKLRSASLRPTKQRVSLARLLFSGYDRHVTAEQLHGEAVASGARLSLATVYNTLHQFTQAGLLRQVIVDGDKIHFDTNTGDHHHFYFEDENVLTDIPGGDVRIEGLPRAPNGTEIERVEVIVRLKSRA